MKMWIPGRLARLDGAESPVDVLLARAREREHDRAGDRRRDAAHGLEIARPTTPRTRPR